MARTTATLPSGVRITDHISLGVVAKTLPRNTVDAVLAKCGRLSQRERDLPAHVVVYYVVALALYMRSSYREVLRCLLEGIQWLIDPSASIHVAGKSGISQARTRLGAEPMRELYDCVVTPIAKAETKGAWYRQWRLMSLDGSTLDVADTAENDAAFGRPSNGGGKCAYPQIRLVSLLECGTHVLWRARMGGYHLSEPALAETVIPQLGKGMLCLADRLFSSHRLWSQAAGTKADLLWRIQPSVTFEVMTSLPDGSYLSALYPNGDRKKRRNGIPVRVIEYQLEQVPDAEPLYRLITTILEPAQAPAEDLAALFHERWEIETALDELKTHLRGSRIVLRSKTPELVQQEFYGLLLAHFAIRQLMHEAALQAEEDPDSLSFTHTVRVVQRRMTRAAAIPPSSS